MNEQSDRKAITATWVLLIIRMMRRYFLDRHRLILPADIGGVISQAASSADDIKLLIIVAEPAAAAAADV